MDKEFVSYEQAVILNKLHYDGDYNYTYDIKKELWYGDVKADGEKYLAAPLKQQVFRWFREKFQLEGISERSGRRLWYKFEIYELYKDCKLMRCTKLEFSTYEETESACIDKLIEIAKQQDND